MKDDQSAENVDVPQIVVDKKDRPVDRSTYLTGKYRAGAVRLMRIFAALGTIGFCGAGIAAYHQVQFLQRFYVTLAWPMDATTRAPRVPLEPMEIFVFIGVVWGTLFTSLAWRLVWLERGIGSRGRGIVAAVGIGTMIAAGLALGSLASQATCFAVIAESYARPAFESQWNAHMASANTLGRLGWGALVLLPLGNLVATLVGIGGKRPDPHQPKELRRRLSWQGRGLVGAYFVCGIVFAILFTGTWFAYNDGLDVIVASGIAPRPMELGMVAAETTSLQIRATSLLLLLGGLQLALALRFPKPQTGT